MKKWKKMMAGALSICLLANCAPGVAEIGGLMQTTAVVHAETKDAVVTGYYGGDSIWNYNQTTKVMTFTGTGYALSLGIQRYKNDVKKIVFSEGITGIEQGMFEDFTALEEIQFSSTVKRIWHNAFKGCTSLKSVNLGDNIELVGVEAFSDCKSLETVTVGSKLKSVYWDVFKGCDNLSSILLDENNSNLYVNGKELHCSKISGKCGENVTYKYDHNNKTLTISGNGPMYNGRIVDCRLDGNIRSDNPYVKVITQEVEKIVVGDKVTNIGKHVFRDCEGLKTVELGKSVKTIGIYAFDNCTSLEDVKLGSNTRFIAYRAFYGCSKLKTVRGVSNLRKIGKEAFFECKNLKSFSIGKFLSKIGAGAFSNCASLKELSINKYNKYFSKRDNMLLNKTQTEIVAACFGANKTCSIYGSVKSIDQSILFDSEIKKFSVSKSNTKYSSKDGVLYSKNREILYVCPPKKTGVVNIDDTTTSITGLPFEGCKGISRINIGKNVDELQLGFGTTPNLDKITISDKNAYYYESNGSVISKKNRELVYCYKTEGDTYTVPDSVKKIGAYSFTDQSHLKKIILSDNVTKTDCLAFDFIDGGSLEIESIHLGKNYKNTSNNFYWLTGLEKLKEISASDENEYYTSLDGCLYDKEMKTLLACPYAVETYKMPDGVVHVNNECDMGNMKEMYLNDSITNLTNLMETCHNLQTLHIGKNILDLKKDAGLGDLSKIMVDPENNNFKSVDDMLYSKDGSKFILCPPNKEGKVTVANGVTTISENAFKDCSKITDIEIPDTVTKVEKNIFGEQIIFKNVDSIVIWVPAGKGEYYKSLFTEETGFTNNMLIMELDQ